MFDRQTLCVMLLTVQSFTHYTDSDGLEERDPNPHVGDCHSCAESIFPCVEQLQRQDAQRVSERDTPKWFFLHEVRRARFQKTNTCSNFLHNPAFNRFQQRAMQATIRGSHVSERSVQFNLPSLATRSISKTSSVGCGLCENAQSDVRAPA